MLLIKPYLGCNLHCRYCYERDLRASARPELSYDLPLILERIKSYKGNQQITLHGGEPLCLPKKDIETILSTIFDISGQSGIQTNGIAIDDELIEMFKKYKTGVGVSFDGPDGLSAFRMSAEQEKLVWSNIVRMKEMGINVSIIAVVSQSNALDDAQFEKFKAWVDVLGKLKIQGRLNPCTEASEFMLPKDRLVDVYLDLAAFCLARNYQFSPFEDIIRRLKGEKAVCTFMGCDIFHTESATVVLDDGTLSNCMRTNKDEILIQYPSIYKTRAEILEVMSQEYGGCGGCKFFYACQGGCPSVAADWRDRTEFCYLWTALFGYFEAILKSAGLQIPPLREECAPKTRPGSELVHPAGAVPVPGKPGWTHIDGHADSPHNDSRGVR